LTYALASCDETIDHLETLHDTESLKDDKLYQCLHEKLQLLGKKLNTFVQAIESGHISEK
jgi:four helix bundle protein